MANVTMLTTNSSTIAASSRRTMYATTSTAAVAGQDLAAGHPLAFTLTVTSRRVSTTSRTGLRYFTPRAV